MGTPVLLSRALLPRSIQIKQVYENKWTKAIKRYSSCSLTLKSFSTTCNLSICFNNSSLAFQNIKSFANWLNSSGCTDPRQSASALCGANKQIYLLRGTANSVEDRVAIQASVVSAIHHRAQQSKLGHLYDINTGSR